MQFVKFLTIQIFSNGTLCFFKRNFLQFEQIMLLKKDLKNFEFYKKFLVINRQKLKYSFNYKNKYLNYKSIFLNAINMSKSYKNITNRMIRTLQ